MRDTVMVILKSYKYKLLPTFEQIALFIQWAGACRYIYNLALEQRTMNWSQFRKSETYSSQCKELTLLKKQEEVQWLNETPAQCLQQSLKNLDRAFQSFFDKKTSYPQFKVKGKRDSFRFPQSEQFSVCNREKKGWIDIPKAGKVRFICSRKDAYEGKACQLTITRDVDQWYVSIQCEVEIQDVEVIPDEDVGIDLGVVHTIATSGGEFSSLPVQRIKQIEEVISRFQRKLSQQQKYGSNWKKTKNRIARLYRRIRRIKEDFIHKKTTDLVRSYGGIAVEDLKVANMTASASGTMEEPGKNVAQKSGLNRSILRASPSKIIETLKYKCFWNQRLFKKVNPKKSSLECAECGCDASENRKSQAIFECTQCSHRDHADHNAARVIKTRAFGSPPWESRVVPVEKVA